MWRNDGDRGRLGPTSKRRPRINCLLPRQLIRPRRLKNAEAKARFSSQAAFLAKRSSPGPHLGALE